MKSKQVRKLGKMDIEGVKKYFHAKWKKPSKEKLEAFVSYKGYIVPRKANLYTFSLGATKVSGTDLLAIVSDRAEILRDCLEEGQDPSFSIKFQMMVCGAL